MPDQPTREELLALADQFDSDADFHTRAGRKERAESCKAAADAARQQAAGAPAAPETVIEADPGRFDALEARVATLESQMALVLDELMPLLPTPSAPTVTEPVLSPEPQPRDAAGVLIPTPAEPALNEPGTDDGADDDEHQFAQDTAEPIDEASVPAAHNARHTAEPFTLPRSEAVPAAEGVE